jgi:membrane protein DedA with SNARE-associated domain
MIERARATFKRHGVTTILIASILPPPAPFKIFVLLAGAAAMGAGRFAAAVAVGRGARYLVLGFLAVKYGDQAMAFARKHALVVSLAAVGLMLTGLVAYLIWSRRRQIV